MPSLLSNQFKLCLGGDVHPVTDFSAVADIASSMPWGLKRFHESHQLRRGERASWNPSYSERAPTRRKSPPKRSLDGPRSRVPILRATVRFLEEDLVIDDRSRTFFLLK